MAWARVMRGISSMAREVTLRSARARTRSTFWCGARRPMSTAPGLRRRGLVRVRRPHLQDDVRDSQPPGSVAGQARSGGLVVGVGKGKASPAPRSTVTSRPCLTMRLTVSGVAATRVSPRPPLSGDEDVCHGRCSPSSPVGRRRRRSSVGSATSAGAGAGPQRAEATDGHGSGSPAPRPSDHEVGISNHLWSQHLGADEDQHQPEAELR